MPKRIDLCLLDPDHYDRIVGWGRVPRTQVSPRVKITSSLPNTPHSGHHRRWTVNFLANLESLGADAFSSYVSSSSPFLAHVQRALGIPRRPDVNSYLCLVGYSLVTDRANMLKYACCLRTYSVVCELSPSRWALCPALWPANGCSRYRVFSASFL